uniref:Transposase n=1 Tax=Heterorhabditis bacteriophora TaxID=37862 RepID=A0A1I7WA34_HETBA
MHHITARFDVCPATLVLFLRLVSLPQTWVIKPLLRINNN